MKRRNPLILLCLLLSILSILGTGCRRRVKAPEEILDSLKEIKSYTTNVNITVKNDRQELKYEGRQVHDRKIGYRLEIRSDRIQIHKGDKIYVVDKKNGAKYELESDFDEVFKLSFIGKYIGLLYTNEVIEYSSKAEGSKNYTIIKLLIPGNNRNLYRAEMYVDKKSCTPDKVIVYDKKDNEKILIEYSEFVANEEVNKDLFQTE